MASRLSWSLQKEPAHTPASSTGLYNEEVKPLSLAVGHGICRKPARAVSGLSTAWSSSAVSGQKLLGLPLPPPLSVLGRGGADPSPALCDQKIQSHRRASPRPWGRWPRPQGSAPGCVWPSWGRESPLHVSLEGLQPSGHSGDNSLKMGLCGNPGTLCPGRDRVLPEDPHKPRFIWSSTFRMQEPLNPTLLNAV